MSERIGNIPFDTKWADAAAAGVHPHARCFTGYMCPISEDSGNRGFMSEARTIVSWFRRLHCSPGISLQWWLNPNSRLKCLTLTTSRWRGEGGLSLHANAKTIESVFVLQQKKKISPFGVFCSFHQHVTEYLHRLTSLCRRGKNAAADQSSWCQSAGCRSIALLWPQSCSAGIISDPSCHPASGLSAAAHQADVIILLNAPELTL